MKKFAFVLSTAIFCLIISAGCATKEAVKNVSAEDALRERVKMYWDYKVKGDYDKAYAYEDPFSRRELSLTSYIQLYANPLMKFTGYEIVALEIMKEDIAEIKVKANTRLRTPGSKPIDYDAVLTERWLKESGEWYHVRGRKN